RRPHESDARRVPWGTPHVFARPPAWSHDEDTMTETRAWSSSADASNPYQAFQNLMPFRVQDILLVSSLYDSFTLQEDGRLNELILGEFLELSLHQMPSLTHVSSAAEALRLVTTERRFNLIITAPDPGDMDATQLARAVKR